MKTYAWGPLDNLLQYIKCYRAYNTAFTEGLNEAQERGS